MSLARKTASVKISRSQIASGKGLQKTMERSTMLLMGKSTISIDWTIFNSYVKSPEGRYLCRG